jgi:hypothetical protein
MHELIRCPARTCRIFSNSRFFVRSRDPHPAIRFALILPMDSRLMPLSRARVDAAQSHRFPEFLQATRQPLADALGVVVSGVEGGFQRQSWCKSL